MINLNHDQKRAVNEKGNILVFASAGGGKTTVLIERLLKRIIKDQISVDKIIAMTFTEAASNNLKNRLLKRIKEVIIETDNDELKRYLRDELSKVSSAKISTIHSFCLSLVKEYYYLVNITLNSTNNIIDEVTKDKAIDNILNNIINQHLLDNDLDILSLSKNLSFELFSFDALKKSILELFKNANDKIDPFKYLDSLYIEKDLHAFNDLDDDIKKTYLNEIYTYIKDIRKWYQAILKLDNLKEYDSYQHTIEELDKLLLIDDYNLLLENIKYTIKGIKSIKGNDEFKIIKENIDSLATKLAELLISEKAIVKTENAIKPLSNTLVTLTKELFREYDNYKHENETIDFNDFEHYAYQILINNNYQIANIYKEYYKEIMIDEFQDTNDIQFEIASLIANDNLFLVGDIKQSIYRFRDAKPNIMESLKHRPDFKTINIRNNYRSKNNLVTFNNQLFNIAMNISNHAFSEEDFQIADTPNQLKDNIEIRFDNYIGEDADGETRALLLANRIIDLHNQGMDFRDIAVLVRSHKDKINIKKVFDTYHIPYFINDNKGYFNSYAIEILESYLKLLLNPNDLISLYSLLTSILYNYSDDDITKIKDKPFESLKNTNFMNDYQMLKTYINQNDFIGFFTYFLSINNFYTNHLNTKERTNFDLLINNLDTYNINSLVQLLEYIDDTADKQKETAMSISIKDNVVRVMTIHTSKGLEFDTVFLYINGKNRYEDSTNPVVVDEHFGLGFKVGFSKYNDRYDSIKRRVINIAGNKEDLEEYLRLLYVALTRPKRCLNFIDAYDGKTYPIDESLLKKRNGFSSIIYSIMKNDQKLKIYEYESIPEFKPLPYQSKTISDIKEYSKPYHAYNNVTPSSQERHKIKLKLQNKGSEYGNNLHNILATLDFKNLQIDDIKYQLPIDNLLNNPIFKEALKGQYHREYPFISLIDNEMIHGFIDFISFIDDRIILIDYKTDYLNNEEDFIEIYKPQLDLYKKVLSKTFNKQIDSYIYAFHLNKMIII